MITAYTKSYLGVIRYLIRDAVNPNNVLVVRQDMVQMEGMPSYEEADTRACWYIVPVQPWGWDIFNADGRKLVMMGQQLRLVTDISFACHWEIMKWGSTITMHFSNFWLPEFFGNPFGETHPRNNSITDPMATIIGSDVGNKGSAENIMVSDPSACMQRCVQRNGCNLAHYQNDGYCQLYDNARNVTSDYKSIPISTDHDKNERLIRGDARKTLLERRLFGDARRRVIGQKESTNEYGQTEDGLYQHVGMFYVPHGTRTAADVYRMCTSSYGLDATLCEKFLETVDLAHRNTVMDGSLGGSSGKCRGPALRSNACYAYCSNDENRKNKKCKQVLESHCEKQQLAGHQEPICDCYMPLDVYTDAHLAATRELEKENRELALSVRNIIKASPQPYYCWYGPCFNSAMKPAEECPPYNLASCTFITEDNTFNNVGNVKFEQSCSKSEGPGAPPSNTFDSGAPNPNNPPPGTPSGGTNTSTPSTGTNDSTPSGGNTTTNQGSGGSTETPNDSKVDDSTKDPTNQAAANSIVTATNAAVADNKKVLVIAGLVLVVLLFVVLLKR